jgi:hypothetical protein
MKKLYLLGLLLGGLAPAHATHLLGGEIQARNVSGLTYEITALLYLDVRNGQAAADAQSEVTLCLGDGRQVVAKRTGTEPVPGIAGLQRSTYQVVYTYAAPGQYTISSTFEKFASGILNMPAPPQEQAMVIQTSLNTSVPNRTAQAPEPKFTTGLRQTYTLPLATTDPDGDSLAYRIVRILNSNPDCGATYPNSAYVFPNEVTREGTFKIDRTSLTWNAPTRVGAYTYAYVTEEWRQGSKVAESWRTNTLYVTDQSGAVNPIPPYEPVQLYESGLVTGTAQEFLPANLNLHIYPIPSDDWIRVEVNSRKPATLVIELMDAQGRVLQKADVGQPVSRHVQEMNMQHLARGIYFVRARSNEGAVTKKVVR